MAGFDNQCRVKRVQRVCARVAMKSTISDGIISIIYRTCHLSKKLCNIHRAPTIAKINMLYYVYLLNRFRDNTGYTHLQCLMYCSVLSILSSVTHAHSQ